ncbi:hypothetical protein H6783_02520 [Candidatus Nomurabacteria bacterium]|nr:hypothetical protein [Candidatus Nomurabacteria bacterium]
MNQTPTRIGSSKRVTASGVPREVIMVDRGMTSVFDRGPIPNFVSARLAVARTTQAACVFTALRHHNIDTHFLVREDDTRLRVKECRVRGLPLLSGATLADMIGLEVLFRLRATEKFCNRVAAGEVPIEKIDLPDGVTLEPGVKFQTPFVEASTKWRPGGDVYLSDSEAADVAGVTPAELERVFATTVRASFVIDKMCAETNLTLDDGKFEFARHRGSGTFMIIDGVSLDELGVRMGNQWFGKNLLRFFYKEQHKEWLADLEIAQRTYPDDKTKWPEYPPLPEDLIKLHVQRYERVAKNWSRWVSRL